MQFSSFADFINMGGYGFYVWLSYGVATFLLVALIFASINGHKRVIQDVAQRQKREEKLRKARAIRKQTQSPQQNSVSTENTVSTNVSPESKALS